MARSRRPENLQKIYLEGQGGASYWQLGGEEGVQANAGEVGEERTEFNIP